MAEREVIIERHDLGCWTLWLRCDQYGWMYSVQLPERTEPDMNTALWVRDYFEGEGIGNFETRWHAICHADTRWNWDDPIPF